MSSRHWQVLAALIFVTTLHGCATPPPAPTPVAAAPEILKPRTLTPAEIKAIHSDVRKSLKDPDSAKFGDIKAAVSDKGVTTVCGLVNAKNSYGGYGGAKPFIGVLTNQPRFAVITIASSEIEVSAATTTCEKDGLFLSK